MERFTTEGLRQAFDMFLFLGTELTILFLAVSFFVGVLQSYLPPERIRDVLSSRNGKGYVLAALLGAITPFCSCSTIPFLKGLLRAEAGFGTMMVFLIASPLLNPIIMALFVATFGWQITAFYFVVAMGVSILAGIALERLGFERYIKVGATPSTCGTPEPPTCGSTCGAPKKESRWPGIWRTTWADFKQAFPYLLVGIALGSFIYGFLPSDFIAAYAGADNPLAVPVAAVIGIPLYLRAEAVIPLAGALVAKGMSLGAVMSMIVGSAGASLTEVILLKALFKNTLIWAFVGVILFMAVFSGYTLNAWVG